MTPTFFSNPSEFRAWLHKNHKSETEILVGFYKTGSGKQNMTWSESVDEALCYGWIDGVRKSIDSESYCIRFTPRKPKSIWSSINISKVAALTLQNKMQAAGIEAFSKRTEENSKIYSFENEQKKLPELFESKFMANEKAWSFFTTQAPSYQKTIIHWILAAKQETTQLKRLEKTILESEKKKRVL